MCLYMNISLHYQMTLSIQRRETVKMNTMLWGICVMGIFVTLTYSAPNGNQMFRGNCEIDDDCMEGYVCSAPGFGKASDKAKKKCHPDETPCCPANWTLNNSSCYFIDGDSFYNQTEATEYCASLGAYVVAAETPEENEFIKGLLQNMSISGWIRLGLSNNGSGYTWDYTGQPPSYTDWSSVVFGSDCASFSSAQSYAWIQDACFFNRKIICEKTCP